MTKKPSADDAGGRGHLSLGLKRRDKSGRRGEEDSKRRLCKYCNKCVMGWGEKRHGTGVNLYFPWNNRYQKADNQEER